MRNPLANLLIAGVLLNFALSSAEVSVSSLKIRKIEVEECFLVARTPNGYTLPIDVLTEPKRFETRAKWIIDTLIERRPNRAYITWNCTGTGDESLQSRPDGAGKELQQTACTREGCR